MEGRWVMTHTPAEAFHPSTFILEEMAARGWTLDDLAGRMGCDRATIRAALDLYISVQSPRVLLGKTADALSLTFGVPADHFARLERDYWAWVEAP
jgi:plasmid maintenance system antidote protein VapI